jgi:hypothetical protein
MTGGDLDVRVFTRRTSDSAGGPHRSTGIGTRGGTDNGTGGKASGTARGGGRGEGFWQHPVMVIRGSW